MTGASHIRLKMPTSSAAPLHPDVGQAVPPVADEQHAQTRSDAVPARIDATSAPNSALMASRSRGRRESAPR